MIFRNCTVITPVSLCGKYHYLMLKKIQQVGEKGAKFCMW